MKNRPNIFFSFFSIPAAFSLEDIRVWFNHWLRRRGMEKGNPKSGWRIGLVCSRYQLNGRQTQTHEGKRVELNFFLMCYVFTDSRNQNLIWDIATIWKKHSDVRNCDYLLLFAPFNKVKWRAWKIHSRFFLLSSDSCLKYCFIYFFTVFAPLLANSALSTCMMCCSWIKYGSEMHLCKKFFYSTFFPCIISFVPLELLFS